jgi:hypothetical protein
MQQFRIFRALGLSFKAWFSNFIPFTLLAAVLYAPVVIWIMGLDPNGFGDRELLVNAYFLKPIYVLTALATLLAPMITYRVVQDLNGNKVSMVTSIKFGLRGIVPAVMLAIITQLLQFIPVVGGIIGAILMCMWFVTTPAAVAERLGPFAAFARSSELTSGRRWGIFGLSFLVGLIVVALMFIWILPDLQGSHDGAELVARAARASIGFVLTIGLCQLFQGIVQAVAYALLRQDKDGVSYQELAQIFE